MDVMSGRPAASSTLNPYAAPFVPAAYRAVEDFSPEWWQLVESNAWFRDYWMRECFQEELQAAEDGDGDEFFDPVLPVDADDLFHSYPQQRDAEESEEGKNEKEMMMMAWGAEKWSPRGRSDGSRCFEKAPKIVSVKMSPRMIQQPR